MPEHATGGDHLTRILDQLCATCGTSSIIRSDNGKEFTGRAMMTWAHRNGVTLKLIETGRPNQNVHVGSLNGPLRDE